MRSHSNILKKIKTQKIRFGALVGATLALIAWQNHFVINGILANVYHNATIVILFLFGFVLAGLKLFALGNDVRALLALEETYGDLRHNSEPDSEQNLARFAKALKPGIVFRRSRILGHVYELCVEELLRTRSMKVSVGTMQQILHAVDVSLSRERSALNYITGLLVLLGLIGTFIGLMEMVGSVGGIIGGVANSDASSQDAVKGLMRDLQAPLIGMATGFSASLFGLAGSLLVGLGARFFADAAHGVKEEFEEWLAGIAQIERTIGDNSPLVDDTGIGAIANAIVNVFRTTQGSLDRSSDLIRSLADRQDRQTDALNKTLEQIERLAGQQALNSERLNAIDLVRSAVGGLRSDMADLARLQESRMSESTGRIAEMLETRSAAIGDGLRDVMERQREISRATRSLEAQTATGLARIGQMVESGQKLQADGFRDLVQGQTQIENVVAETAKRIDGEAVGRQVSSAVEARFSFAMNEMVRSLDSAFEKLALGLEVVAGTQDQVRTAVQARLGNDGELRALGQSIETGMAQGFAEVARAIDSVFAGYADLLQRERDRKPAGPAETAASPAPAPASSAAAVLPPELASVPASPPASLAAPGADFDAIEERLRTIVAAGRR